MRVEVVTKEDLQQFRIQLLNDIRQLLLSMAAKPMRPWLKNSEVKKMMNISPNTIRKLRISGKLRSSKVGGVYYYRCEDIEKMMEGQ